MRHRAAAALLLVALGSCEYGAGLAPSATPRIVVHAVLNAGASEEVVLVEQTLVDGRQCVPALFGPDVGGEVATCTLDPDDPIVSSGGEPISNAEVVVYGPAGDSALAVEDVELRGDGKGAGVYRFTNAALGPPLPRGAGAALAVVPGATYRLRVTTPLGTATARTTIPDAPIVSPSATVTFNVERGDVARSSAVAAEGAAAYLAVLDGPLGTRPRRLFDAPPALLAFAGSLFAGDVNSSRPEARLQASLLPGLASEARVSAVDTNFARSLRAGSEEDPFSSENPGNSIEGGVGVFGSLVPTTLIRLEVVSYVDEPIEGRYVITDGPTRAPRELRIFSYRGNLSGSFAGASGAATALFGARSGGDLRIDFYGDRFAVVRIGTFEGRYASRELRGTFTAEGETAAVPTVYRNAF